MKCLITLGLALLVASQVSGGQSFPRLFRSGDERLTIKIVSPDRLELTIDAKRIFCSYSRFGDSLRVVAASLGSVAAYVFKTTSEGLVSSDGVTLYDDQHFHPAPRISKLPPDAVISAVRPEYPYNARRSKITGGGVVLMTVDVVTGNVTGATMAQSTGSPMLDNAALSAFRTWRFKPRATESKVWWPVTFTMSGAQY